MKRTALILVLALLVLASGSVGCKRTAPIQSYGNASVSAYGNLSAGQVRDAIVRGASNIGWSIESDNPGLLTAKWTAREHIVTVDIPYSSSSYTIRYKSSVNMLAEGGEIHRNYNRWVERLQRNINAELAKAKK